MLRKLLACGGDLGRLPLLVGHVRRQHLGELVVLQTTAKKLVLGQVTVAVLVHAGKDVLRALL